MVTEAGKELLRASINTAKFHNKVSIAILKL